MINKVIVITGGLGYVGGRLTEYFCKNKNHLVYTLTRRSKLKDIANNFTVLTNDDVLIKGKLNDVKIDLFIHLASLNEHECMRNPEEAIDINVKLTLKWLNWSKQHDVKKFIYFSTAHVYSKPLLGVFDEESMTTPSHPYSITHKSAEDYVLSYNKNYRLNSIVVRLTNSFGYPAYPTADRWTLFINDICKQVAENKEFKINSNPLQKRDFISLNNVCEAIEIISNLNIYEYENRIFNISSGKSRTLLSIAEWIKNISEDYFDQEIKFDFNREKSIKTNDLYISNEKLTKAGWNPDFKNDELEIKKTLEFFYQNK